MVIFGQGNKFSKRKEISTSNKKFICFECRKQGHIKTNFPSLQKKNGFKGNKDIRPNKS